MSLGTPFLKSPIYNQDGYLAFLDNRVRGFHLGVSGNITEGLQYRVLVSYRYSYGTPFLPSLEKRNDTSAMIEGIYDFKSVKGLQVKLQLAIDR